MVLVIKDSYCIEIAVITVFNFGRGWWGGGDGGKGEYAPPYIFFCKLVTS